jgi:nucleotide-binding universal stress UspA family protein
LTGVFHKILCPVDFDAQSAASLDFAVKLALQNQAGLLVLTVAPLPLGGGELSPVPLDPYTPIEDAARANLENFAREHVGNRLPYETIVTSGNPATFILNAIRTLHADLVVMGTHSRKGVTHFLLGSVAERVVRESPVPVLTIPRAHPS